MVATPSPFAAEALKRQLSSTITQAVARVAQSPTEVVFQVVDPSARARTAGEPQDTGSTKDTAGRRDASFPSSSLRPHFTFATFIVGTCNELAHAAAAKVAEAPGRVYNPLYIYSDVGLGKTHLAQAIAHALIARGHTAIYVTSERFTNDYIGAIREGRADRFREHYRSTDVLVIDDIQ
ncbi:MAG: ATP-binding protein, partial [Gemmatimonadetes bacterium]|nr:ATP-binding protein [Gemmatimonadota bacterium]